MMNKIFDIIGTLLIVAFKIAWFFLGLTFSFLMFWFGMFAAASAADELDQEY